MLGTRSRRTAEPEERPAPSLAPTKKTKTARAERHTRPAETSSRVGGRKRSRSRQLEPTPVVEGPAEVEKKSRIKLSKPRSNSPTGNDVAAVPTKAKAVRGKDKALPPVREEEYAQSQQEPVETQDDEVTITPNILEIEELARKAGTLLKLLLDDNRDVATLRGHFLGPSGIAQRLRFFKNKLDESKATFGKQEYISIEAVHRALKTQDYDPVLHEVNLAILTTFVFTATHEKEHMFEDLKALDGQFPGIVGESITAGNFDLVLDLRTQTLIAAIRKYKDAEHVSPVDLLNQIFYAVGGDPRPILPFGGDMKYPGWKKYRKKRELELHGLLGHDDAEGALEGLREKYPWDDFARKVVAYSRRLLQDRDRQDRIATVVAAVARSFLQDVEQLDSPVLPEAKDEKIQPLPVPAKKATVARRGKGKQQAPRSSFRLPEIRALEQELELEELRPEKAGEEQEEVVMVGGELEELSEEEDHTARIDQARNFTPDSDGSEPKKDKNDASPPLSTDDRYPSPSGAEVLSSYHQYEREKNKENQAMEPVAGPSRPRFLDPQPGATRVEFDTQIEETQSRRSLEQGHGKKRRRTPIEDEDDSGGFEEDRREEDGTRRKRSRQDVALADPWVPQRPIAAARSSGASLVRHSNASARSRPSAVPAVRASSASIGQVPAGSSRVRRSGSGGLQNQLIRTSNVSSIVRGSDIHRNELVPGHIGACSRRSFSSESREDSPEDVSHIVALNRLDEKDRKLARKGRGARNAWTDEQANELIKMIRKYGTNWQLIVAVAAAEGDEHPLRDRTNVNLKDKARNLKLQFLRTKRPLPVNFDKVTISKKDEDLLYDCGVDVKEFEREACKYGGGHSDDEGSSGEGTAGEDSGEIEE